MSNTTEHQHLWKGHTLLANGFRSFFLGAALWATLAMVLWIAMLSGFNVLPIAFDPISWHAHEFLYGYLMAVVAGFLLTAVPNWTGRPALTGWPLGGLFALWIAGRAVVSISAYLPWLTVALIDLAMPTALAAIVAREIVAGRNWRNLIILGILIALIGGNAVFHWEHAHEDQGDYGLRIGLGAAVMMIAVIGGRIVPSFTRNWLVKRGPGRLPAPPMQTFDKIALIVLMVALTLWVAAPFGRVTAAALFIGGALHFIRLARWAGDRTLAEPLVLVLHLGYLFLPIGAICLAVELALPGPFGIAAAQHLWMAGAIGLMTLAVMTRATLGHSGRALSVGAGTSILYLALIAAVGARVLAGVWPAQSGWLHSISGLCWLTAFGGFALLYGPLLLRAKPQS